MQDTKHSPSCQMAFGRKDPACPRCQELLAGQSARAGWQQAHFTRKAQEDLARLACLAAHFAPNGPHQRGECGPVCTFGDA